MYAFQMLMYAFQMLLHVSIDLCHTFRHFSLGTYKFFQMVHQNARLVIVDGNPIPHSHTHNIVPLTP